MPTAQRFALCLLLGTHLVAAVRGQQDDKVVRVFVFAGQSNMVGSDSRVADVERFPPFADAANSNRRCGTGT